MNIEYKIINIGTYPPPYGGISVYLYRLTKADKNQQVLDENKMSRKDYLKLYFNRYKHYILHSASLKRYIFFYLLALLTKNIYSIVSHGHGLRDIYINGNKIVRQIMKKVLNKAQFIQVVNPDTKELLVRLGVNQNKVFIKRAFLPPPIEEEKKILESYDKSIFDFIKIHYPIVIANAAKIVFYNNVDLYGIDMMIGLMFRLKKNYPNIGLLFGLAEIEDEEYYTIIRNRIKELNIKGNICFITGQKEIWPLFKKAQLMVRPTFIDGYGISIEEALYFGCQAIASNVCERPDRTILFRNRDLDDLLRKVNGVLSKVGIIK